MYGDVVLVRRNRCHLCLNLGQNQNKKNAIGTQNTYATPSVKLGV